MDDVNTRHKEKMQKIKAAVCHEFNAPLVIEDILLRAPEAGEVEVTLDAVAICHSDISFAEGAWGGTLPAVYGHEAAGRVSALGPGVKGLAEGDAVIVTLIRSCGTCPSCAAGKPTICETPHDGDKGPITTAEGGTLHQAMACGAFAEKVVVDQRQVVVIPRDMPRDAAALVACGVITGVGAVVNAAGFARGESGTILEKAELMDKLAGLGPMDRACGLMLADTKASALRLYPTYQMLLGMMATWSGGEFDPTTHMPRLADLLPHLGPAAELTWVDQRGLHVVSSAPFPGATLLTPDAAWNLFGGGGGILLVPMQAGFWIVATGSIHAEAPQMQASTQGRGIHQALIIHAQSQEPDEDGVRPLTDDLPTLYEQDLFTADYAGGVEPLAREVTREGGPAWDVADMTMADHRQACREGLLAPMPDGVLADAPDGTPAEEDFIGLGDCFVPQIVYATLFAYNTSAFSGEAPDSVEDVFNTSAFPGRRGLRKTPRNNIEWALMADGVAPRDVYEELRTDAGVQRAFSKLDELRGSIEWWESGSKPQEWLDDGTVSISAAYNGRIFNAVVKQGKSFDYIWDGQIWEIDLWVIPRGADNLANILEFVAFSTGTRPLAEQTEYVSYAPARKSSLPLIRREYRSHMPTSPANFRNSLQNDFIWWADNQQRMDERFDAWLGEG